MKNKEVEKLYNTTMFKIINDILLIRNDKMLLTKTKEFMDKVMKNYYKKFETAERKKEFSEKLKQKKLPKISENGKTINKEIKQINPIDLTTIRPYKNDIKEIYKCNFCGMSNINKDKIESHISKEHYKEKEFDISELEIYIKSDLKPLNSSGNLTLNELKPYLSRKQLQTVKNHRNKKIDGKSLKLPIQLQTLDKSEFEHYTERLNYDSNIYYVSGQLRLKDGNIVYRIFHTDKT